jgi:hypothetical protein
LVDIIVGNGTVMFVGSSDSDDPVLGTGLDAALDVGGSWTEACFVLATRARCGGFVLTNTTLTIVVLAGGADILDTALDVGGSWTEACFVLTARARGGGFVLTDTALTVVVLAGSADVLDTALDIGRSRTEAWFEMTSGAADNVGVKAGTCTTFA